MTRVLHLFDHSVPLHSGYTFRSLAILREQRRMGLQTVQMTSPKQGGGDAVHEDVDGFRFYRTAYRAGVVARVPGLWPLDQMRATRHRLAQIVARERPDLIHAHSPALNAWPAIACGRAFGLPVVYEVRAFWEDAAVDHGTATAGGWRYRATRRLETLALRRADAVIALCEGLRADIVQRGVSAARVTTVPNGVDVCRFRMPEADDDALARRLGLGQGPVVGFCGSFYAYEGLDLLMAALPGVLAQIPSVRLLLVGGGPQEAALRTQAKAIGVADRVVFAGRVPNQDIDRYYRLVDVLAFARKPMRLTELVTPLKPLEAMAMGLPVVASDVGGHRELIQHGRTGLLFPAGDVRALSRLIVETLRVPELRARLAAQGRALVARERTWQASLARTLDVYDQLLAAAPRAGRLLSGRAPGRGDR